MEEHEFSQGDMYVYVYIATEMVVYHDCTSVIIRPEGVSDEDANHLPLHKHWVAKIKEIRAKEGSDDVSIQKFPWSG